MEKTVLLIASLAMVLFAVDSSLQDKGVKIKVDGVQTVVKREVHFICSDLQLNVKNVWGGEYANMDAPEECKKTFITSFGKISPVQIDGIKTFGELETLEFIDKLANEPEKYVLVDSRTEVWYQDATLAGAVNFPFTHLTKAKEYSIELSAGLKKLGVVINKDGTYDFSTVKTALFFCNGIWCGQSLLAIDALVKLGFPKSKMLWYRGGLQDWRSVGLSVYKPKPLK